MRSFDSLYHFTENGWSAEAQSHGDPIFTPLFTALFSSSAFGLSVGAASAAASIASAIAVTSITNGVMVR